MSIDEQIVKELFNYYDVSELRAKELVKHHANIITNGIANNFMAPIIAAEIADIEGLEYFEDEELYDE